MNESKKTEPQGTEIDNVTVNGVPVDIYIAKKESDRKAFEIAAERRAQQKVARYHAPIRLKYRPEPQENSGVRRLSDNEIRREYGIMAKPFETVNENILWLIWDTGPLTVKDMQALLDGSGMSLSSVSAKMSVIWQALGDEGLGLMKREKLPKSAAYIYEPSDKGHALSFEMLLEVFRPLKLQSIAKQRRNEQVAELEKDLKSSYAEIEEKRNELSEEPKPEPKQEQEPDKDQIRWPKNITINIENKLAALSSTLKDFESRIEKLSEHGSSLNVNVSGGIKVTFEFKVS